MTIRLHFSAPLLLLPGLLFVAPPAGADVELPAVIADHMVLQQELDAPIWGSAAPGEAVRVRADWLTEEVTTEADADGNWMVRLRTPEAGGPHSITITGGNTITLEDVMIGEVWVCSGQSNMEFAVESTGPGYPGVDNYLLDIGSADFPDIRLFNVANSVALEPRTDCTGTWARCSPDTVRGFSAVAYFFGREIHFETGVPIGLIGSNWGGTPAEAWTSAEFLGAMPDFADGLARVAEARTEAADIEERQQTALAAWWAGLAQKDAGSQPGRWMSAEFADEAWDEMVLPVKWEDTELGDFDGIVWFRKAVEIPAAWAGRDLVLELGPIDDMDTTWFNGARIGGFEEAGYWTTERRYTIPASAVKPGRNVIAVRAFDSGGAGGLWGDAQQLTLAPSDADGEEAVPLAGPWRYRPGAALSDLPPWPSVSRPDQNSPTTLFNGMIAPLIPFAIRGAIWYQGESNRSRAHQYRTLFPTMIHSWRAAWGQGDFPFYFVQIAPFGYGGDEGQAAELREAQLMTLAVKNTGMAVTMDIGNADDIHPTNKHDVGKRLALWALAKTYGREDLVYSGPIYRSHAVEGAAIRMSFAHVGGGLVAEGGELTHFTIAGSDQVFVPARAVIDGDTIVVASDTVPHPIAVRYGWGPADAPNLFNAAGLPASSFRTDAWPGLTQPR